MNHFHLQYLTIPSFFVLKSNRIYWNFIKKLLKQKQLINFPSIVYIFIYIYHNFQISYILLMKPNLKEPKFSTNQMKIYQSLFHLQHLAISTILLYLSIKIYQNSNQKITKTKATFSPLFNSLYFYKFAITFKFFTFYLRDIT